MTPRRLLLPGALVLVGLLLVGGFVASNNRADVVYRVDPDSGALSFRGPLVAGLPDAPQAETWYPVRVWVPRAPDGSELEFSSLLDVGVPLAHPDVRVCPPGTQGEATPETCTIALDDATVSYSADAFGQLPALIRLPQDWAGEEFRLQYVVHSPTGGERLYVVGNYTYR